MYLVSQTQVSQLQGQDSLHLTILLSSEEAFRVWSPDPRALSSSDRWSRYTDLPLLGEMTVCTYGTTLEFFLGGTRSLLNQKFDGLSQMKDEVPGGMA